LANACRGRAKSDRPTLTWLGLDSLFRSLARRIDDRAVETNEAGELTRRLEPLAYAIARPQCEPETIEEHVVALRELL